MIAALLGGLMAPTNRSADRSTTRSAAPSRALLSAHRAAAALSRTVEHSWESLLAAVHMPVEYIEFDVQRTADGVLVLFHDEHVATPTGPRAVRDLTLADLERAAGLPLVRYESALRLLAAHGKKGHLDFKFRSPSYLYAVSSLAPYEVEAARLAADHLPEGHFIVTTCEDRSVRTLRRWADAERPDVRIGLSLGRHCPGMFMPRVVWIRLTELFPGRRMRRSRADLVVVNHWLADLNVLRWAARRRFPVLVWTVDTPSHLDRFLADPRVWMVTSNRPPATLDAPCRLAA
jgi:glycerophosphoryl diester phosphodiesterase